MFTFVGTNNEHMKTTEVKIADLKEADYNPRKLSDKQAKELRDSLEKFGMVDPIIINRTKTRKNIIVGGHQRKKIWTELGNKTIPCIILQLSLEDEKELNVRLNKNTGEFDTEKLQEHFSEDELLRYGFEDFELGLFDEVDYSAIEYEELDEELVDQFQQGVKQAIQIEFKDEDFEEAKRLHHKLREQGKDLGMILLNVMEEAFE